MEQSNQTPVRIAILMQVTVWAALVQSSHFRGGTINWKSVGGNKVHFYFKLGWTFGNGPGCTQALIGKFVNGLSDFWECKKGCNGNIASVNYYCTGANQKENWEQGSNDFTYTFPSKGPFNVGYESMAWITLSNGKGGGHWNVFTTVDLRTRSDTGNANSSPESLSKPMYYVQFGCEIRIKLPVIDPDDDTIRCRWAVGAECGSVCGALPYAHMDEETCTVVFNTTAAYAYAPNGIYAASVIVEDFPKTIMTMENTTMTPNDALSRVPLQFLVTSIPQNGPCDAGPRFVPPTPKEKEVIVVEEGDKMKVELFADNNNDTSAKANDIRVSGPIALTQSPVIPDVNRTDTFTTTLTWQTTHKDIRNHIICASVKNDKGKSGNQRCFSVKVVPKGCKSSPCQNNGKCVANMGNYTCVCRPGFTGHNCDVNIDDCFPNACNVGLYCIDGINGYTCSNVTTTTTPTTTTEKNYTGVCPLAYDHCQCAFRPHHDHHDWMGLSRQLRDFLGFSFGFPFGLAISVFTFLVCRYCRMYSVGDEQNFPQTKHAKTIKW